MGGEARAVVRRAWACRRCPSYVDVAFASLRSCWHRKCYAPRLAELRLLEGWPFVVGDAMEGVAHGARHCSLRVDLPGSLPPHLPELDAGHHGLRLQRALVSRPRVPARALLREPLLGHGLLRLRARLDVLHVHHVPGGSAP